MTSGEKLLTVLLMKIALDCRQVEVRKMTIKSKRVTKRWVANDDVLDSPNPVLTLILSAVLILLT